MATRQRQFPELVITRSPEAARIDLEVYSKGEVDNAIGSIDLSDIETDISDLQGDVSDLSGDVSDLSGGIDNLETDIENLDISFTKIISEQCLRADSPVVTGSDTTLEGFIEVNINGNTYKLALIS